MRPRRHNTIYDNDRGIDVAGGTATDNRVYNNRDAGIQASGTSLVQGNQVYQNLSGIWIANYSNRILNNLFYDNPGGGIYLPSGAGSQIENNTVIQNTGGDAVQLGGPRAAYVFSVFGVSSIELRNNILVTPQGYAINVAADSELGLQSDYNDLFITGTGRFARWEDHDFLTRADWFYELGLDGHSITADPQFLDAAHANFAVALSSPTIDAGDPQSPFDGEPSPNGRRANLGHTGNTSQAAFSPDQLVQVLSPNGLEKLEQGQQVSLKWRTAGIVDPTGGYADTILADQPAAYFRLGESPGATTAKDASGNGHGGNYNGSFTLGSAGSMPAELDTAINFTGGGGYVSVPDAPTAADAAHRRGVG